MNFKNKVQKFRHRNIIGIFCQHFTQAILSELPQILKKKCIVLSTYPSEFGLTIEFLGFIVYKFWARNFLLCFSKNLLVMYKQILKIKHILITISNKNLLTLTWFKTNIFHLFCIVIILKWKRHFLLFEIETTIIFLFTVC